MLVDVVTIKIQAGNGGHGLVSFRREKYVQRGGPNGGDGGDGGDVIFKAMPNEYDLTKFRYSPLIKAENGQNGGSQNKKGHRGQDVVVTLPCGTLLTDLTNDEVIADLTASQSEVVLARGGSGGYGNTHFKSSTRRTPLFAEKGLPGESKTIRCELKLIAQVGLVGLPNAGKSTLLKAVTSALPKIGDYPFTTLSPNLGVTENGCLLADIPGLIEGAALGKGLGHQFLRHIERSLVLLHLIDCQQEDVVDSYRQIIKELRIYKAQLLKRPQMVALTKIETLKPKTLKSLQDQLLQAHPEIKRVYLISAQANLNLPVLLTDLKKIVARQQKKLASQDLPKSRSNAMPVFKLQPRDQDFVVKRLDSNSFLVSGNHIEILALKTDFSNYHSRQHLLDVMSKMGVVKELVSLGCESEKIVFGPLQTGPLYLVGEIDWQQKRTVFSKGSKQ